MAMAMVMVMHGNGVDGTEWKRARNRGGNDNGKGNTAEMGKQQPHLA